MLEPLTTPQPYGAVGRLPGWLAWVLPPEAEQRLVLRRRLLRILIVANLLLGLHYLSWRYLATIHWQAWPISLALLAAETYSFVDALLFGLMMWRLRRRPPPPPPPPGATVDVLITCYNEPVELVRATVRAALAINYPHRTYLLDDGNAPGMQAMAKAEGCGYITRSADWRGQVRHAKAGNLNNALLQTDGEFLLILDADQLPGPEILGRVLGYFRDPTIAFVQTPQWFYNVPAGDPFGSQAPLFYGPIQQGKDGWNAAFFCGSNAVLRRAALVELGLTRYVAELTERFQQSLASADRHLRRLERQLPADQAALRPTLAELRRVLPSLRQQLAAGATLQEVVAAWRLVVDRQTRRLVQADLRQIQAVLAEVPGLSRQQRDLRPALKNARVLATLCNRRHSPLMSVPTLGHLLLTLDLDRADQALPLMPFATISVTEDMATAMRLHAAGWRSVYHDEILVRGLAPEDLRSALQQRLRWAQGTIQVMLRESPLRLAGLSLGQRLMYLATMWSYLAGWFGPIYLAAPVLYLIFGVAPTRAESAEFLWRLIPFLVINQLVFMAVSWGRPTWRGQQYSLALFPLWVASVTSAIRNVYFGGRLGFVVTPKTRQAGVALGLVRVQLAAMLLLVCAILIGLGRLAFGLTDDGLPILVNVGWAVVDLVMLSAVIDAAVYQPADEASTGQPGATSERPADATAAVQAA